MGTVVVRDGLIVDVGPSVQAPAGAEVVDATGRHVYPGMFDAVSQLGLTEVGAVDVTNDSQEQGDFNPHLQAATAIHPATEHIPVARANGITHTMAAPQGGIISGQASLVGLDGWTVEEMDIDPGAAMVVNFPSLQPRRRYGGFGGGGATSFSDLEKQYQEQVARLDEWMDGGRRYAKAVAAGTAQRSLELEAMARVVSREMPVLLSANGERDIRHAVEWAERQNIRYVITGGSGAWKIADWLGERHVQMILGPSQTMPAGPDEEYDEPYANAGKLHAAGVKIAFATFNSSDSRTLPYEAAMAVPYGLPREAALEAVMKNGAEMLGLGDRMGTIEPGQDRQPHRHRRRSAGDPDPGPGPDHPRAPGEHRQQAQVAVREVPRPAEGPGDLLARGARGARGSALPRGRGRRSLALGGTTPDPPRDPGPDPWRDSPLSAV